MIYFIRLLFLPPLIGGFYLQEKDTHKEYSYERNVKQLMGVNNICVL